MNKKYTTNIILCSKSFLYQIILITNYQVLQKRVIFKKQFFLLAWKKYIGIGPSAHSFDGKIRSWNISNNSQYVKHIVNNRLFYQNEHLSKIDQYNEYVMTGLRTIWGISLDQLEKKFGKNILIICLKNQKSSLI